YFKTAHAGWATRSIVESVSDKVHVYVFLPPNSAVLEELESYFDSLTGPKLELHRVDQTARPRLARELSVRSNGKIVFSTEEVTVGGSQSDETSSGKEEKPGARITESMQIATKLDQAREDLKDLDQKVQKRLLAVSSGNRVAYLTTGHGELSTGRDAPRNRRLQGFKRILEAMSFRVDKLGVGQGLAEGVPDDADLVAIIGPTDEFLPSEIEALKSYLDRGGSLLLAMEPPSFRSGKTGSGDKKLLTPLLDKLGVSFGEGVLAAESGTIPLAHNKTDKLNVVTNRFSSHPSTATLSKHATALFVFTPSAGYFELDKKSDGETTTTVRSPSAAWADVDGDFKYESDAGESRKDRAIAVAANGEDEKSWRALATADATLYSDLAIGNRGNQQFVYDGVNWLIGAEALSGGVQSEEDVKIRHTKEGQAVWFYGTVFAVPLLLLAGGGLRIWRRRKRHEREA
ncbi:MAG: Gldg family protein, partial [Bradymonadaceae bacterium]